MRLAIEISITLTQESTEDKGPRCEVLLHGRSRGVELVGACLEAAIYCDNQYLLFITHDCPFEETLSIYLLDSQLNLLDRADMFWVYATGNFRHLEMLPPKTVSFDFFDVTPWTVELLDKPGFRVPLFYEPAGVWRRFNFSRHFVVRHVKPKR